MRYPLERVNVNNSSDRIMIEDCVAGLIPCRQEIVKFKDNRSIHVGRMNSHIPLKTRVPQSNHLTVLLGKIFR